MAAKRNVAKTKMASSGENSEENGAQSINNGVS